jgi:hypothetical protein
VRDSSAQGLATRLALLASVSGKPRIGIAARDPLRRDAGLCRSRDVLLSGIWRQRANYGGEAVGLRDGVGPRVILSSGRDEGMRDTGLRAPAGEDAVSGLSPVRPGAPSRRSGRGVGEQPGRTRHRFVVSVSLLAAFSLLVTVLYVIGVHAFAANSDCATVVLEGRAMRNGHVLLGGWALSLDSFWSIDAVFYAIVELFTGLRSMTLYLVPAIIAALVIVVAAVLAGWGRRGAGRIVGAATVVALLAFPSYSLSNFFLRGAVHVGTVLWCLIAFASLSCAQVGAFGEGRADTSSEVGGNTGRRLARRTVRANVWGPAIAVVFLAAGILGDAQTIVFGVAPVFGAGVVATLRTRRWRAGIPAVTVAGASIVLAWVIRQIADALGTYSIATSHPTASLPQALTNVKHIVTWGPSLLGVSHGPFGEGKVPIGLQAVHVLGLAVVVVGVGTAAVALVRGAIRGRAPTPPAAPESAPTGTARAQNAHAAWMLEDLLVLAFFGALAVFVVLTATDDPGYLRYMTAPIVFASILAGRWMARLTTAVKSSQFRRREVALGVAVTAAFATGSALNVSGHPPSQPATQLGQFLESHQLRLGIGDYWSASITTVITNGAIAVRPVIATPNAQLLRYQRQSTATWYSGEPFQFLVYNAAQPWAGVDEISASETFGRPARIYAVGTYRVLVWDHPLTVSARGYAPGMAVPVEPTHHT